MKPSAPDWYLVDASGKSLGRLAAEIARILRGKHKTEWSPHQIHSDHIIVTNTRNISMAGKKSEQKTYVRHSGYFGHLKRTPFSRMFKKNPNLVVARAVKGMLPRNKLRPIMMRHLHLFESAEHPHDAQKPRPLSAVFSGTTVNKP